MNMEKEIPRERQSVNSKRRCRDKSADGVGCCSEHDCVPWPVAVLQHTGDQVTMRMVSDHRGSNSQAIDFESVKIYSIFTIKIENPGKSNT
jgi:hypothetical protein